VFLFSVEKKVLQQFGGSFAKQKRGTPLFLLFLFSTFYFIFEYGYIRTHLLYFFSFRDYFIFGYFTKISKKNIIVSRYIPEK